MEGARVVEVGADRIDELEPAWRALYEHHREIARGISPMRPFEETWRRRRAQYRRWLAGEDAGLLVAERTERIVGYAMLTVGDGPATWDFGRRVVEIETLTVVAEERGGGVGAALTRASEGWARGRDADVIAVGLYHANDGARRFYEREGFRPFYLDMARDLR
jgi:GNAT superfamily N-acetyltransferase